MAEGHSNASKFFVGHAAIGGGGLYSKRNGSAGLQLTNGTKKHGQIARGIS